jgi:hypothetical protein
MKYYLILKKRELELREGAHSPGASFSKVSARVYLLYKAFVELTFDDRILLV